MLILLTTQRKILSQLLQRDIQRDNIFDIK